MRKRGFQDDSWASYLVKCDTIIETGTLRGELGRRMHRESQALLCVLYVSRLSDIPVEMCSGKLDACVQGTNQDWRYGEGYGEMGCEVWHLMLGD